MALEKSDPPEKSERMEWMGGALKAIPNLGKLLVKLTRDPRVPTKNKLIFGGVAAYLLLPIDFIPDFIPGIGQIDELALIALGLDAMVNRVPAEVVAEHWDGDGDVLETIRKILSGVTSFVPEGLKQKLFAGETTDEAE